MSLMPALLWFYTSLKVASWSQDSALICYHSIAELQNSGNQILSWTRRVSLTLFVGSAYEPVCKSIAWFKPITFVLEDRLGQVWSPGQESRTGKTSGKYLLIWTASGQLPSLVPADELALKSQGSTKPAECCSLPLISLRDVTARQDGVWTSLAVWVQRSRGCCWLASSQPSSNIPTLQ